MTEEKNLLNITVCLLITSFGMTNVGVNFFNIKRISIFSVVPMLVDRTDYNYLNKLKYKYGK